MEPVYLLMLARQIASMTNQASQSVEMLWECEND